MTQKKNILIIGHPLIVGENRRVWSELAKEPLINVDLVCPKKWKSNLFKTYQFNAETEDKYFNQITPVTAFFKGNGSLYFFNPFTLFLVLWRKRYQKVVLTQETWSMSLFTLNLIKIITPNIMTAIDLWICQNIKKENLRWLHPFERLNNAFVDKIMCCCREAAEVIKWKKIPKETRYFPFSFNGNSFTDITPRSSKKLRLGYIGRLGEEKGMPLLFEVYQDFILKNPDIELHIAGSGEFAPQWLELSQKHHNVIFHGPLPHDKVNTFYNQIDVCLVPSQTRAFWKEQFGRVIVEASAAGKVVIGSRSGAIPEVMGLLNIPYLFDEASKEQLIEHIQAIKKQKQSNELISQIEKTKQLAFELFTHEKVANLYKSYLFEETKRDESFSTPSLRNFI